MPELPAARRARYQDALGLSAYDAAVLVADADAGRLFEATLAAAPGVEAKPVANWVTGDYLRIRNAADRAGRGRSARPLGDLVRRVADGAINRSSGREVLEAHAATGEASTRSSTRLGLAPDLRRRRARHGRRRDPRRESGRGRGRARRQAQAIGFLVGQVMKATRGQANAAVAGAAIRERLDGGRAGDGPEPRPDPARHRGRSPSATRGSAGPWASYQALKAQEQNIARYESWRGGLRDSGTTGASVAMEMLRGQVRQAA